MTPEPFLVDTNIHVRSAHNDSPQRAEALAAVQALRSRGSQLYVAIQNLVEFWNVATRPATARGGLGMTIQEAEQELEQIESFFLTLPESPPIQARWKNLVVSVGVSGVRSHDARLVATMLENGVTHILTFDTADFAGFPGITALSPPEVLAQQAPTP